MATGRLTDIIKARRESGEGVASSLAGGFKERLKEKFDPRNVFKQDGLLTSLFPQLKAYKAKDLVSEKADTATPGTKPGLAAGDSVDSLKPLFLSIEKSTKIISKNNAALSLIQRDTNLMKQTLSKIVKILSGRKKETKVVPKKTEPTQIAGVPQAEEDDKGGILGTILGVIAVIKGLINSVVGFLKNIIGSFVKNFLPVLRTIAQLGTRFLPMLASVPVLVAVLAALAAYSVYKLGLEYKKNRGKQSDLIYLTQREKDGSITESEKEELKALRASGISTSPAAGRAATLIKPSDNFVFPMLENLEKAISNNKKTPKEVADRILEATGFDISVVKEYRNFKKENPKSTIDLTQFARDKGIENAKAANIPFNPTQSRVQEAINNRIIGFGDEISATLIDEGQLGGNSKTASSSAKSPISVLKLIEDYKKDNDDDSTILKNKTIFLSTGFENSNGAKKEFDTVKKQISTLKSMGASDNAIKILGVSEASKNATEINAGLQNIAKNNNNEYLPVANKKKLGKTFVSAAMSKTTLPIAAADVDDQKLGQAIASALAGGGVGASTAPTPAPSATDTGGASELGGSATAPTPTAAAPDNMYGQDTYTTSNTGSADLKPALSAGDDPPLTNGASTELVSTTPSKKDLSPLSGDSPPLEPAPAAASQTPQTQENGNPEPIKQNKLPIDDPYNDQHPQFSSLIKKLANEYGVPA